AALSGNRVNGIYLRKACALTADHIDVFGSATNRGSRGVYLKDAGELTLRKFRVHGCAAGLDLNPKGFVDRILGAHIFALDIAEGEVFDNEVGARYDSVAIETRYVMQRISYHHNA